MYEKPSVKVYELRQTPKILAGSGGVRAMRSGYGTASTTDGTEDTWQ